MAMYCFILVNRSLHRYYLKTNVTRIVKQCKQTFHEKVITIDDDDAFDEFTSQLVQKKAFKWNTQKAVQKSMTYPFSCYKFENNNTNHEFNSYSIDKINSLYQEYIEVSANADILNLTKECVKYRKCPSLSTLIQILTICAQNGDKDTIISVVKLCEEFHPDVAKDNSHFKHYLAEATWIKGNVSESLQIFKEVYSENVYLRRQIRLIFKYLMQNVIATRSEATLITVVKFAEEILHNYKDFFPLACVWQACFLSEWFSDQCLALKLLETNKGLHLHKTVVNRIPYVVRISLNNHRTEIVYRLLELLLKHEMKIEYAGVLTALLDYHISFGDLRRTTEIIQWSINNNIPLPAYQNEGFFNLLLDNNKCSKLMEKVNKVKREKVIRDLKF